MKHFFLYLLTSPIIHGLTMGICGGQLAKDGHPVLAIGMFVSFAVTLWFMIRGRTAMDTIDKIRELRRQ